MNLDKKDIDQLHKIGITKADFDHQIDLLTKGTDNVKLIAAATVGNGLVSLQQDDLQVYSDRYANSMEKLEVVKFVPASGAATRMFKDLIRFTQENEHNEGSKVFFENLSHFPFYKDLLASSKNDLKDDQSDLETQLGLAKELLYNKKFEYANIPKGMIPFHMVNGKARTAFEEHFRDAVDHTDENKSIGLHFTVSLTYRDLIKELLSEVKQNLNQTAVNIRYSLQSQSTDTIALTEDNQLVRDVNGDLLFRPGGHGALLKNLNNIHADLVFIRNIDNVIPRNKKRFDVHYEKVMAGYLLKQKSRKDAFLLALEENPENNSMIDEAMNFIDSELKFTSIAYKKGENKRDYIFRCLDRPMRICGMVKNEGEPGGGPFLVEKDGLRSLQIIESSQINSQDAEQLTIMNSATHFNPVDLVCSTRDHHSEKYDLMSFRAVETSFIARKTYMGKPIKALEWPGLWNGAMYNWITFFMEIPLDEFNPVKTVNDLLRENHQPLDN